MNNFDITGTPIKTITIFEFIKAIKEDIRYIKLITADGRVIHVNMDDDDRDFREILAKTFINWSVDNFEINFSSKTKTLILFTSMTLSQIDCAFDLLCKERSTE